MSIRKVNSSPPNLKVQDNNDGYFKLMNENITPVSEFKCEHDEEPAAVD